jgi:hypothetical protein
VRHRAERRNLRIDRSQGRQVAAVHGSDDLFDRFGSFLVLQVEEVEAESTRAARTGERDWHGTALLCAEDAPRPAGELILDRGADLTVGLAVHLLVIWQLDCHHQLAWSVVERPRSCPLSHA